MKLAHALVLVILGLAATSVVLAERDERLNRPKEDPITFQRARDVFLLTAWRTNTVLNESGAMLGVATTFSCLTAVQKSTEPKSAKRAALTGWCIASGLTAADFSRTPGYVEPSDCEGIARVARSSIEAGREPERLKKTGDKEFARDLEGYSSTIGDLAVSAEGEVINLCINGPPEGRSQPSPPLDKRGTVEL